MLCAGKETIRTSRTVMICRLCLLSCDSTEAGVQLFGGDGANSETDTTTLTMIRMYLNIELNHDDPLSTLICRTCSEHLEKFHRFRVHVTKQQHRLHIEFPEMKCNKIDAFGIEAVFVDVSETPMELRNIKVEETAVPLIGDNQQKQEERPDDQTTKKRSRRQCFNRKPLPNELFINANMKLECDICQIPVESYGDLRCHFNETHKRPLYVKCCDSLYHKPNKLVEHLMWHLKPELFKCDICGKQLKNKQCLDLHKMKAHLGQAEKLVVSAKCHLCDKVYGSLKRLENHVKNHSIVKIFSCEKCDKTFSNRDRLRRHTQAIHDNIYPHVCDSCGKKFKFKPSFERHILEHQGIVDPPVQCAECGHWMKNKHALRLHRFKHDTRNVQCKVCGRVCPSRIALRGHMDYMHKMRNNLQCTYCSKTFKMPKSLQEHVATHTGVQLYACPYCTKQCRSKSNMYVHIKRHHTEEWLLAKMARSNDPSLKEPDISADEDLSNIELGEEEDYTDDDDDEEEYYMPDDEEGDGEGDYYNNLDDYYDDEVEYDENEENLVNFVDNNFQDNY